MEFNRDFAVSKATRLFWRDGYSNTSLRELVKVMEIGEGSFYNTFKSKKNLYIECLKHYNDTVTQRRMEALLSQPTAKQGIRCFFKTVLDELELPETPRVCLMAGSLSSDVLGTEDLNSYVCGEMERFTGIFVRRLELAKETGELPEKFQIEAAVNIIFIFLQGLFRVLGILQSRAQVESQIEILLEGLGL